MAKTPEPPMRFMVVRQPGGGIVSTTSGAPQILYTDIVSGPTSGGENNLGWYLSIFGVNFGAQSALGVTTKVFIGNAEIANYRELNTARNGAYFNPPIQRITVQLGSLGGAAAGSVLPVKVVVGGIDSNTDKTFTVQPGPILFVDEVNGADVNAGTLAAPKKNMQLSPGGIPTGGALNTSTVPGTCLCLRGGAYSSNQGKDQSWFRFWRITGAPVTGAANAGYINVRNYPGPILGHTPEVPHYTSQANTGGIRGNDTARAGETTPWGFVGYSQYVAITGLWIEINSNTSSNAGAAPVNLESSANFWRVIDNELGPWPTTTLAQAAGVAGNGDGIKVLGNYIHDIAGLSGGANPQLENHGVYFDESVIAAIRCEAAWNVIKNITAGSGMQCFSNYSGQFLDIEFHHNWIENARKYGMAISNQSKRVRAWNNVIKDAGVYSLYVNTAESGLAISFVHNTLYNAYSTYSSGPNAMIVNNWNATSGYVEIAHNILVMGSGRSNNSLAWYEDNANGTAFTWRRNVYFDPKSVTTAKYSGDATGIYGNPQFKTPYTDFRISATSGSPAIGAATGSVNLSVATDFDNFVRPVSGQTNKTIGAFEPYPASVAATATLKQFWRKNVSVANPPTLVSGSNPMTVTPGRTLIAYWSGADNTGIGAPTTNQGAFAIVAAASGNVSGSENIWSRFARFEVPTGVTSLTVTPPNIPSAGNGEILLWIVECAGLPATPTVRASNFSGVISAAQSWSVTSANGTPVAGDLCFVGTTYENSVALGNAQLTDPPTGFTSIGASQDATTNLPTEFAYQIVPTSGAVTTSWSTVDTHVTEHASSILVLAAT